MKRILITGKNSYVGNSFAEFLLKYPDDYKVDKISLRDDSWKDMDFSVYDVILHVAGIAHVSTDPSMEELYYKVNRDLTIEVATKAKKDNVKQFIFMSSMIVFGNPKDGKITKDTKPNPENFYGKSKLEAEVGLKELEDDNFVVSIMRPPMIYGPNSKGNYAKLAKLAKITPIFPDYPNRRSMLFIDNLSIFLKEIIDEEKYGTFHPQNNKYVQTSELVKEIAKVNNHKIYTTELFNPIIKIMTRINFVSKIFGDLYYEEIYGSNNYSFDETIRLTEVVDA